MSDDVHVLFVDDEVNILKAFERLFRKEDVIIETVSSPKKALEIICQKKFGVIISDLKMPEMDGIEFLSKVQGLCPETVRILLTGHGDLKAAVSAINRAGVFQFLTKPWNDQDFKLTIQRAASHFQLIQENERLNELTQVQNRKLRDLNDNLEKKVKERAGEVLALNKQLNKTFLGTIQMLANLTEMHNAVVGSHSKRVAALSKVLAKRLNIEGKPLFEIEVAAIIHDIGKIALPSEILKKPPSNLSSYEGKILRDHTVKGESIAKMIPNLGKVPQLIRSHHERFDGGGYPDGLEGEETPLGARIIGLADFYDHCLNARTSFDSSTPIMALQQVIEKTPSWFDPKIVEELKSYISEKKHVLHEVVEVEILPRDLRVGMKISKDLVTVGGMTLLRKDVIIRELHLARVLPYLEMDPPASGIFIYRQQSSKENEPQA